MRAAQSSLDYFSEFARGVPVEIARGSDIEWAQSYFHCFQEALNNDLNTPQARQSRSNWSVNPIAVKTSASGIH